MNKALEKIRRSILAEAEEEAARVVAEARAGLEQLLRGVEEEEERKVASGIEEERARLAREGFREISRAQRGARLALLAARNRVIDGIFSRVREEALRLPPERYREILRRWLSEADAPGGGEVLAAARDAAVVEGLVAELNRSRPPGAALRFSDARAPFESGVVVRTARFEIGRSLDEWIAEKRRELAPALEAELFGEGPDAEIE